jgi:hypothetical protein
MRKVSPKNVKLKHIIVLLLWACLSSWSRPRVRNLVANLGESDGALEILAEIIVGFFSCSR